jgi:hypothetical protein
VARKQSQSERYRRAARLAIEQLDWCVNYFHRIGRPQIGEVLRRNRNAIVKRYDLWD